MKKDIYETITNKIVAALESGVRPWSKPWNAENTAGRITRPMRSCGKPYSGINVLVLWCAAEEKGYSNPVWMTYKQAQELGGNVRKGEKSETVVYASKFVKTVEDANGNESEQAIPFMKSYAVFNVEQIDGLPAHFYGTVPVVIDPVAKVDHAEAFFAATGAVIKHGGDRAYYTPTQDFIQMPMFETFRDAESYYSTLAHECTHWTKAPSRLDRDFGRKRFGDEGYAMEELVAELGASFLSADLRLALEPREDHAAYIASWLRVLKNDKRAIFTAASHAQKAADYLNGLQDAEEQEGEREAA